MDEETFKTLKKQVEYVLENFEQTRNSDVKLTIFIWQEFYDVGEFIRLERLFEIPTQEAVKRARAKIQNTERRFPPTNWEVAEQRDWQKDVWQKALGYYVEDRGQGEMFPVEPQMN